MSSLQNKENFFTPPTVGKYEDEDEDTPPSPPPSLSSGSTEEETVFFTEEEDKDDLGNAWEFHEYMMEKGHVFLTWKGKLLWYLNIKKVYPDRLPSLAFVPTDD